MVAQDFQQILPRLPGWVSPARGGSSFTKMISPRVPSTLFRLPQQELRGKVHGGNIEFLSSSIHGMAPPSQSRYYFFMKIAAIREVFVDEWVATQVTQTDKADVPLAGEVVFHSPEKQRVYQGVKAHLAQHPETRMFIFFTGDPIPEHVEVMLAFR